MSLEQNQKDETWHWHIMTNKTILMVGIAILMASFLFLPLSVNAQTFEELQEQYMALNNKILANSSEISDISLRLLDVENKKNCKDETTVITLKKEITETISTLRPLAAKIAKLNSMPGDDNHFIKWIAKTKKSYAEGFSSRAECYVTIKNIDLALKDFAKAIELAPKETAGYKARGIYFAQNGQKDKAIADFEMMLKLDPNGPGGDSARMFIGVLK